MRPDIGKRPLVYDAGMLVALDSGDRRRWAAMRRAIDRGFELVVPAPVVAQAWRSSRQARLAHALDACKVEPVDEDLARVAGVLCGKAGTSDAVDAIVVASAARHRGTIITSDRDDIATLARHAKGVTVNAF